MGYPSPFITDLEDDDKQLDSIGGRKLYLARCSQFSITVISSLMGQRRVYTGRADVYGSAVTILRYQTRISRVKDPWVPGQISQPCFDLFSFLNSTKNAITRFPRSRLEPARED